MVIDMISCPYCRMYVVEGEELVCERCTDKVELDFAIADLTENISRLEKWGRSLLVSDPDKIKCH